MERSSYVPRKVACLQQLKLKMLAESVTNDNPSRLQTLEPDVKLVHLQNPSVPNGFGKLQPTQSLWS